MRGWNAGPGVDRSFLVRRARAAERVGEHGRARKLFEEALHSGGAEDAPTEAALLRWIGVTHRAEGDTEAALDCFRASKAAAVQRGNRADQAHALNWFGIVYLDRGRLDLADRMFGRARRLARQAGNRRLVAMAEQNLGISANIRGDVHGALDHYQRSLSCYRRLGEDRFTALVLNDIGMAHTDLGHWPRAAEALDEAAAICDRVVDLHTRVMVEVNRAELALAQHDLESAERSCDVALVLGERLGQEPVLGEVFRWVGAVRRLQGHQPEAEHHLLEAARIADQYGLPLLAAESQRELAEVFREQDRNRDALVALSYAHRLFTGLHASRDLAEVGRRLRELESAFMAVVQEWGESIESKDRYTAGHCRRVADYSVMLAKAVGLDPETLRWFRMGAFLHDIGKIAVPGSILNKPGRLTPEERRIMERHTEVGADIVAEIEFPWDIRPMVRNHHERWDGTGYPDGLAGHAIPLAARILCVADIFDALTTTRSYRPAFAPVEALAIMRDEAGQVLDPDLFARFETLIREPDAGLRVA